MPKFLTFKSPSSSDLKENPLKALFESFQSLDQFTRWFLLIILLLILSTPFIVNNPQIFKPHAQEQPTLGEEAPQSVPDEILVKFKAGVADKAKEKVRNEHGLSKVDEIKQIGVERLKVPQDKKDQIIEVLKHNPKVKYAEANYIVNAQLSPNDTYFPNQWHLARINAPTAWDITAGGPAGVIAILDTGMDTSHEDLVGRFIGTPSVDDNGHGTHVGGAAGAATNNGKGVAGVCWFCPIMSVKVLSSGGVGTDYQVATGINYSADYGARVINMSLGGGSFSQTMQNAVNYAWNKGIVVIAASGNDGTTAPTYPAALNNVVAVGFTDSDSQDTKDSISNYGPWLDLVAPGLGILTPKMGGSYVTASGTSLAAPLVTGLAGLIISVNPSLTNQQVVNIITSTADDLGVPGKDDIYGYGRINACKALKAAVPSSSVVCPTTTSSPTPIPSSSSSPSPSPSPSPTPIPTPTPDTTAPTVNITSPISGSTVSGSSVSFNVDASDNVGVTKVEFYVDNALLPNGTEVSAPYTASWDSTTYSNSSHSLTAKAYDNAGNVGTSAIVTVTVNNLTSTPSPTPSPTPTPTSTPTADTTLPTVSIISPFNGAIVKVSSKVNISANVTDNVGISKVEFYVSGSLKYSSTLSSGPYSYTWSVPGKKNANYTITTKAYDSSNNTSSSSISVKTQ